MGVCKHGVRLKQGLLPAKRGRDNQQTQP